MQHVEKWQSAYTGGAATVESSSAKGQECSPTVQSGCKSRQAGVQSCCKLQGGLCAFYSRTTVLLSSMFTCCLQQQQILLAMQTGLVYVYAAVPPSIALLNRSHECSAVVLLKHASHTVLHMLDETSSSCCLQNQLDSQYSELLSQSQAEVPTAGIDEGEVEGNLRQLHQDLLQAQQQLMTAHADCERAQRAEEEAHTVWEAKRSGANS